MKSKRPDDRGPYQRILHFIGTHLRLEVIGRHLGRKGIRIRSSLANFSRGHRSKERDVGIFLRFGNTQLIQPSEATLP